MLHWKVDRNLHKLGCKIPSEGMRIFDWQISGNAKEILGTEHFDWKYEKCGRETRRENLETGNFDLKYENFVAKREENFGN